MGSDAQCEMKSSNAENCMRDMNGVNQGSFKSKDKHNIGECLGLSCFE